MFLFKCWLVIFAFSIFFNCQSVVWRTKSRVHTTIIECVYNINLNRIDYNKSSNNALASRWQTKFTRTNTKAAVTVTSIVCVYIYFWRVYAHIRKGTHRKGAKANETKNEKSKLSRRSIWFWCRFIILMWYINNWVRKRVRQREKEKLEIIHIQFYLYVLFTLFCRMGIGKSQRLISQIVHLFFEYNFFFRWRTNKK